MAATHPADTARGPTTLGNLFGGDRGKADLSGLLRNAELPPAVQSHLQKVYTTLAMAVVMVAAGAAVDMRVRVGGILTSLVSVGLVMMLAPGSGRPTGQRTAILAGCAFAKGLSIGPLVALAAHVDPSLIVTAFLGTATVFACFTASAVFAKRQQFLALGGILGSGVSLLLMLSFANMFFRSAAMYSVHLYLGLVIFSGYVLYDTQLVIERARAGNTDYIWDALELLIDFVAIFVRILIILLKNSGDKKERKRSTSRR